MISAPLMFRLVAALMSVAIASHCAADILTYSNINAVGERSYQGILVGYTGGLESKSAQRFTPTTSGQLSKLEMAIAFDPKVWDGYTANRDELTLTIVPDNNGKPGTTELWTDVYANNSHVGWDSPLVLSSFDVESGLTLQAGTSYWAIAASNSDGFRPYVWYCSPDASTEPRATYFTHSEVPGFVTGEWLLNYGSAPLVTLEYGLRVSVIPEPATASLTLAASAALLAVRRRTSL